MSLAKTSLLNGLAVVIKLSTSLVLNKLLAVYVGPAGYAVIGQFQSFIGMLGAFAGGAFNTGVTKYVAEHHDDHVRQQRVWQSAATMGLIAAGVFALALVAAQVPLAQWLLADADKSEVMIWLAVSLPFLVLNGLLLAIMNGRKATKAYVVASIAGSLLSASVAGILVVGHGLYGALVAVAIGQAIAFIATAWLFRQALGIPWRSLAGAIDGDAAAALGRFAMMAATSAIAIPISHMFIRDGLAQLLNWETSGLWQALWRISETHLMLLTTTLSLYFLPRYSEIRLGAELRQEVRRGYKFVVPLVSATGLIIYVGREPLIHLLLTPEFMPISGALGLQLLGDALKIGSWVTAFTMLSHARTRLFIISEVAFAVLLTVLTLLLSSAFGLAGSAAGYALTYAIYWVVMHHQFARLCRSLDVGSAAPMQATQ